MASVAYAQSIPTSTSSPRATLQNLLERLNGVTECLQKNVDATQTVCERLAGPSVQSVGGDGSTYPTRVALLGGLEDLVDRAERASGKLSEVNARMSDAL